MTTSTKKGSKNTKAKPRRAAAKTSAAKPTQTIAELRHALEARNRDLTEALKQQTATSQILGVIASSPTDLPPVLDVVAENAAKLCDAQDAVIFRLYDDVLQRAAIYGPIPMRAGTLQVGRGSVTGRAVVDRQTIHVHDIEAESEADFPDMDKTRRRGGSGARTRLAVPLLRKGMAIGAILIRRMEVRPFTDQQIALHSCSEHTIALSLTAGTMRGSTMGG